MCKLFSKEWLEILSHNNDTNIALKTYQLIKKNQETNEELARVHVYSKCVYHAYSASIHVYSNVQIFNGFVILCSKIL